MLARAGTRPTVVATGRDNVPAGSLYERFGFVRGGDEEVLPGLWITRYAHTPERAIGRGTSNSPTGGIR